MANTTISELPLSGPITGAEAIPVVQNGTTVQTTAGALFSQGITNASPITLPFAMYANNYMGVTTFGPAGNSNKSKFVALSESTNPANYLTWQFIGGSINGINIPKNNPLIGTSITLTSSTVTFEDNGQGIVPNQYTDFVNSIMEGLNLVSRIITNNRDTVTPDPDNGGYPYWNQMNYCNADTFLLLFQETGSIPKDGVNQNMTINWGFKSYNGISNFTLFDYGDLNLFENMASVLTSINQGVSQRANVQQY